ncbi:MAG TPA: hypothetical protein VLW49_11715 [Gaiellaceae bacterium]|nr:hypothetical protein [Gaiellaceae bacterium]
MSLFRPARTVTTPSGEYWELYVSKTVLPEWREGRPGSHEADTWPVAAGLLELPLALVEAIWSGLVRPLLRVAVLLPGAWLSGRRSRAIRIEALRPYPSRRVLLWTTTEGQVDGVLEEIAAGLAEGRVVQPVGAVYSGQTG